MNNTWNFRQPEFTFISDLTSAQITGAIILNWVFPTDHTDPTTHDPSSLISYELYRYIEIKSPTISANGGYFIDANQYNTSMIPTNIPEPIYKQIATLLPSDTTYTDKFTDMSVHADEGISYSNGIWVDYAGNNVLDEIFHTNRRLHYKIVGVTQNISNHATPFIYMCHTDGVECRSTLTQVKWNTLYNEGDTVWFNDAILNCNRTAIDLIFDVSVGRKLNVWVSGNLSNKVYVLDGRNGKKIQEFTLPFSNILGLRVDPDTGNGIIIGNNSNIYRCILNTGNTQIVSDINTPYAPNGNNGLVLTNENNNHFAYVIANQDTISKNGIDTSYNNVTPRTKFGCTTQTNANIPNILGITNGADGAVWVNGHVPINYKYYDEREEQQTIGPSWMEKCPGGVIDSQYASDWNKAHEDDISKKGVPEAKCENKHYVTRIITVITIIDINLYFLQDIGYIYGVTSDINNDVSNLSATDYNNGIYHPYTSISNRGGWFGISPQGVDSFGRPYNSGGASDPRNSPNPSLSQKGIASDYPSIGTLSGNTYNIFQVNEAEDTIHKLSWHGDVKKLEYNFISNSTSPQGYVNSDYWSFTDPVHVAIDAQNSVWVLQETLGTSQVGIVYQMANVTTFPFGGLCTWPILPTLSSFGRTINYIYGTPYNDPYIEFYLTRNITFHPTLTTIPTDGYRLGFGVTLSGNLAEQKRDAYIWCNTGNNYTTVGKKLYPNYGGVNSKYNFPDTGYGRITEYNSDNLGTCYNFAQQFIYTYPAIIHPRINYPQIDLKILKIDSTPTKCDNEFWNNQIIENNSNTALSGYDDLNVELSATLFTIGSFIFQNYNFFYDDKIKDIGGHVNTVNQLTLNNTVQHLYNDPSINGKPLSRWQGLPAELNGKYTPFVQVETNTNCYYVTGSQDITETGVTSSNLVTSTVWERWPTAQFFATPYDTAIIRQNVLTAWNLSSFNYPVGDNGVLPDVNTHIISGYDPVSAVFTDYSITRTWPISTWHWTFGDKLDYGGFLLNNNDLNVSYIHETSAIVYYSIPASNRDECTTQYPEMTSHVYKGPGTYLATLWVQASNSATTSWTTSAGVIDPTIMVNTFTVAASREIKVLEICPNIMFTITSAYTITGTFTDDNNLNTYTLLSANWRYDTPFTNHGLVSGYAPYVNISLHGTATARSLPFSALKWDYSDPYSDPENIDRTLFDYPTAGWPNWNNTPYEITGNHTFVMPGFYNITLLPVVSAMQENYISNCSGLVKNMQVLVEEIVPQPMIQTSYTLTSSYNTFILSGISPITTYFNASATIAGSFQICRIDWDFGDNSSIVSIYRMASTEYINYYNTSSFSDISDPRNIIVSHEYNRTAFSQPETYTVSMSVYACNTNTVVSVSSEIGPIELANINDVEGDIHLIETRMYNQQNDLLLVFEGEKSKTNFTVLLSSSRL